jgi:predicted RNA-binding Zn-ribbon protein involved in translation (DUF1610 family)
MTDEQRAQRIHYHMYDTNEGIDEHAERIVALEELCVEIFNCASCGAMCALCKKANGEYKCVLKMRELGIEVD